MRHKVNVVVQLLRHVGGILDGIIKRLLLRYSRFCFIPFTSG
ncbi:MAG: hypothetical protein USCAAHI_01894 [Beijerinckiaceae bacterium]|nr:MAG: hypothetical protein USCAAHI_01894 [Beijerinckiaceae bacterium]